MCRSEEGLSSDIRRKIALFASLPEEAIVSARDVPNIYEVPLSFQEQGVDRFILEHFGDQAPEPELTKWRESVERAEHAERTVRIALVGKYVRLEDAYLSVCEALRHAAWAQGSTVSIEWIDSELLEQPSANVAELLGDAAGILIPGGFGGRGIEGKITAARFARERGPRSSGSASACTSRSRRWRGTSPGWRARTRPSSTTRRRIP